MAVKIEVIPWAQKAGEFGVSIERDGETEAYIVGSRSAAEEEARRIRQRRSRYALLKTSTDRHECGLAKTQPKDPDVPTS